MKFFIASLGWKNPQDFIYRFLVLNVGLFFFALGAILVIRANLGFFSWDVFHWGITLHSPLSLGQASQLVGLFIIVVNLFLGTKPGLGTVMNMIMIGFWEDQLLHWNIIPQGDTFGLWAQILLLICGPLILGLGSGLYIKAGMGSGPRDGLMLGISRKTGWRVAVCRTIIEITVSILGWILGGPLGVGTVLVAFALGPSVEFGFWVFRVEDPRKRTLPQPS